MKEILKKESKKRKQEKLRKNRFIPGVPPRMPRVFTFLNPFDDFTALRFLERKL